MRYLILFAVFLFSTSWALAEDTNVLWKANPQLTAPPSPDSRTNKILFRKDTVPNCPNVKGRIQDIASPMILQEYQAWKEDVCAPQGFHMAYSIDLLENDSGSVRGCQIEVSFSCEDPKDPHYEDLI